MQSDDWRPRLEQLLEEYGRRQAEAKRSGIKPNRIENARAWHAELVDNHLAAPTRGQQHCRTYLPAAGADDPRPRTGTRRWL
jgi:hypothetical protein